MRKITKWCEQCGGPIKKERSKFCSDACRQKAYRRRLDPQTGTYERQKERIRNGVMTKADTTLKSVCAQCGLDFYRTGTQVLVEYCSNACKQKAYRARKKVSSTTWAVGDRVISDTGREGIIREMRGTTAAIITETIGAMKLDRYHMLNRLQHAPVIAHSIPYEDRVAFSLTSGKTVKS